MILFTSRVYMCVCVCVHGFLCLISRGLGFIGIVTATVTSMWHPPLKDSSSHWWQVIDAEQEEGEDKERFRSRCKMLKDLTWSACRILTALVMSGQAKMKMRADKSISVILAEHEFSSWVHRETKWTDRKVSKGHMNASSAAESLRGWEGWTAFLFCLRATCFFYNISKKKKMLTAMTGETVPENTLKSHSLYPQTLNVRT